MNDAILGASRFLASDDPRILEWDQQIDRVHHRFPGAAILCWGMLAHLQGDADHAKSLYDNSRKNGVAAEIAADAKFTAFCNLVYASRAQPLIAGLFGAEQLNIGAGLPQVLSTGAISHAARMLEQAERANIGLSNVDQIAVMREIVSELTRLGASDAELAAAIDCAGEVLRKRRLFWQDRAPRYLYDKGTGCMGVRYRIDVSPSEAAEMNEELTDLLIDRNVHLAPVTLGFIGTAR